MSSMSTPVPSGTPVESKSFLHIPRSFKNPEYTKNANRRTRTLKQILAAERDEALGIDPSKKSKAKKTPGPSKGKNKKRVSNLRYQSGTVTPAEVETSDQDDQGDVTMASNTVEEGDESVEVKAQDAQKNETKKVVPTYQSVEAPPSLRPRRKFCDVTGLLAPYRDPKTGLHYHSVEIYEIIKQFGPGVDQAYLHLRGESSQIK